MSVATDHKLDLWALVLDTVTVDPNELLKALDEKAICPDPDFRTRVLLRDAYLALQKKVGEIQLRSRLSTAALAAIDPLLKENLGGKGFSSLESRLMDPVRPQTIESFFRELGLSLHQPCSMNVGGSCGLILSGLLNRGTDDVDAVNEVPAPLRNNHELLEKLVVRYGLRLAHFQSHYLPDLWETRLKSFGVFGLLQVFLVDPTDIALGKLFSRREKDLDDVRAMLPSIEKAALKDRLQSAGKSLLSDAAFRQNAERNWYILFGDSLPA